jgi:hypothetical protein
MGLTLRWDSARYKLYTRCTAEAKKHDGVREKLRGLDYGDLRSKRHVVHSVPLVLQTATWHGLNAAASNFGVYC